MMFAGLNLAVLDGKWDKVPIIGIQNAWAPPEGGLGYCIRYYYDPHNDKVYRITIYGCWWELQRYKNCSPREFCRYSGIIA